MNKNQQTTYHKKSKTSIKIKNLTNRVRVIVNKSLKYDYIQAIDDQKNVVLTGCSTAKVEGKTRMEKAHNLGILMAKKLKDLKIDTIAFDRRGYRYHGRIKEMAQAMRDGGIKF